MTSPHPESFAPEASNRLVLVVEDEEVIRELVCEVLELEGFSTKALPDADVALEFMSRDWSRVALLLTDINMPGTLNGADLARLVMRNWPHIPIIVMSGFESRDSVGIAESVSFVRKPFALNEMLASIHGALETIR